MSFAKNVFINCPFDPEYINDILKPMMYVLIKNGFAPRITLEISDSGQVRLDKITAIIKSCKYSIHDLSIVKSSKANEFARMNMPFELGIDYGLRNSGIARLKSKQFLILESIKYDYMKAISDINGFDVKVHSNKAEKLFECLYAWCSETLGINKQEPPLKMFYDFADFNASLFEEKLNAYGKEELAKNYIENISIPEYIKEIKQRV
ncbi:MAG: hypothetical protein ABJB11_08490 [Ferruginibacter sp.]